MAMKLSVIISIVKDPSGRTLADLTVCDVFKIEAIYTNIADFAPPAMSGWEDNNSKDGVIYKYIAYADNKADLESKISTLNVSHWAFPSFGSSTNTPSDGQSGDSGEHYDPLP